MEAISHYWSLNFECTGCKNYVKIMDWNKKKKDEDFLGNIDEFF